MNEWIETRAILVFATLRTEKQGKAQWGLRKNPGTRSQKGPFRVPGHQHY